jgi:hypothetical protein
LEERLHHPERLERALQALAEWCFQAWIDAAPLIGQDLHRVHHADPTREIRPEEAENCLAQSAFGGAEGGVEGPVEKLRSGTPPVDRQLVPLHRDRTRVLQEDVFPQG